MDAAEKCLKKQLERDRSHDPVYRAYMTVDDYKSENAELRKQLEIANKIAADNPGLFIENCNLKAEIAELKEYVSRVGYRIAELKHEIDELKEHCKAVDEVNSKMRCCANCKNCPKQPTNTLCRYSDSCGKELDKWELVE